MNIKRDVLGRVVAFGYVWVRESVLRVSLPRSQGCRGGRHGIRASRTWFPLFCTGKRNRLRFNYFDLSHNTLQF